LKIKHWALVVLFLFCSSFFGPGLYPDPGRQQVDLVTLKKEEEKRKKKLKKTKYVVTNESLKNIDKTKGTGSLSKAPGKSKTGEKTKESISPASPPTQSQTSIDSIGDEMDKEREEKCKHWQGQKRDLIYEIYKTKADIRDMILEHNKIAREFDLATGEVQNKMMERVNKLSKDFDNGKKHIVAMEKEMVELAEKARKDGALPGCLREIEYPPSNK